MASASSLTSTNEHIQVYTRVRPLTDKERRVGYQEALYVTSNNEVVVKDKTFKFTRSFGHESNQATVYDIVVQPLIKDVLAGFSCTVFAYGQTGTGKTHTMIGEESPNFHNSREDVSQVGIIPRAVYHLFDQLTNMGVDFSMRVSFLELYNEKLIDLLSKSDPVPIKIYDDNSKKGSIIVHGLEEIPIYSSADVYEWLAAGQSKRKTASTFKNQQSSRSHTIFSISVYIREKDFEDGEDMLKVGKLYLVDLAGSESMSKIADGKGNLVKECANINRSLTTLSRVIIAITERKPHIPYRDSKLTRFLKESLGGSSKTSIIATVSPVHSDLQETLSTLEYAFRAKRIQNKPTTNAKLSEQLVIKLYTEKMDRLMASLSENETAEKMNCSLDAQNKEMIETTNILKCELTKIQKIRDDTLNSTLGKRSHSVEVLGTASTDENATETTFTNKQVAMIIKKCIDNERKSNEVLVNNLLKAIVRSKLISKTSIINHWK